MRIKITAIEAYFITIIPSIDLSEIHASHVYSREFPGGRWEPFTIFSGFSTETL